MAKAKARKTPGIAGQGNFEQWAAMQGKRSSNAAQPHDNRPKRSRTRSTSRKQAIAAGW